MNCVVEKTRKKNEVSIAEAADAIGIPRSLIDIRHGKQRELGTFYYIHNSYIVIFIFVISEAQTNNHCVSTLTYLPRDLHIIY